MPKLLIVTDAWTPQVNGVVTGITNITQELQKQGVEVTVIHTGLFKRVLPFFAYPEIGIAYFPGARMRELFKQEQPDYVHIATEGSLGQAARRVCINRRIPFTTFFHTNFPLYISHYFKVGSTPSRELATLWLRRFHSKARAVFVSTPSMKEELERQGHTNVVVSPNGADISLFVRDEDRVPDEARVLRQPLFVYFGRVAKEKNIEEFLRLELAGTKLVIGDGPHLEELRKKYRHTATFVGYKKGQDLVDWLSACDVSVFPSRTDTFGLVVVEALACGLPVAAHDVVGPRDIITSGVDGYLSENLKEAAEKSLGLSRARCRQTALTYSWEAAAETFWKNVQTYV
ncbi:MAG: glycosyltransferase family 1 protein [Patescibacteria group bacterium]